MAKTRASHPQDPRRQEPSPPFPEQQQEHPGEDRKLDPEPDHGEATYEGRGLLKGKVALITGADSGIGRAVAIAFAREGADIAFSYLGDAERPDAEETVRQVQAAGRSASAHAADLSSAHTCGSLVKAVIERFGRIDVLVNNASFQGKKVDRFEDLDADRIQHTFATNVEAMFHICREALPHMRPGSAILNTTSIQASNPTPGILDYAASKAAIVHLTKGLSQHLIDRGIRVNAVAPGPVRTPLITQSFDAGFVGEFGEQSPMGRPAQPAELAPIYVFFASDQARYITGEVAAVTGGMQLV